VTYVSVTPCYLDQQMYTTVSTGTSPGLYRSTNNGSSWTLVLPNARIQAITKGWSCGTAENATVFAGGVIAPGGPPCTLSISTDSGSTWSCSSFQHIVADLQIDCFSGDNFKDVYVTSGDGEAVWRSADMGVTFAHDHSGISDCCASNISPVGEEVGTLSSGLYTRNYGPVGAPWALFDTNGLTDLHITRWLRLFGTVSSYIAATPSGAFYYGDTCPVTPCP